MPSQIISLVKFAFTVIFLTLTSRLVYGEVFASLYDMEVLADLESQLLKDLNGYIRAHQKKLRFLQSKLDQLKKLRPPEQSVEEVISDPVNAYTLVRRLTRDWPLTLNLMMHNNFVMRDHWSRLPDEQDMASALRGLYRLQTVYGIDSRKVYHGRGTSARLTALDFFELGKYASKEQWDYKSAVLWFKTALEHIDQGDKTLEKEKVLPHLFLVSCCMEGNKSNIAPRILQLLLTQYPDIILDKESAPLFKQVLSGQCPGMKNSDENQKSYDYYYRTFNEDCQGARLSYAPEAKCFYVHYNNPRLLIAPFKMEEINIDPPLLLFHNVISDHEIEEMKTLYSKVRENCKVDKDGEEVANFARTCDVGWVNDEHAETAALLTRRVGDITDLDMTSSEPCQVASYGLGGEFLPHYDTVPTHKLPNFTLGGRLATLMFYVSDVEEGGYTVFPNIGKAVTPAKGSAVVWFNIDHEGEPLDTMLHGGCPVVRGSKWVINKWIHEGGQSSDMLCPVDKVFPRRRYYVDSARHR